MPVSDAACEEEASESWWVFQNLLHYLLTRCSLSPLFPFTVQPNHNIPRSHKYLSLQPGGDLDPTPALKRQSHGKMETRDLFSLHCSGQEVSSDAMFPSARWGQH